MPVGPEEMKVSDNKIVFSNFEKYIVLSVGWGNLLSYMISSLLAQHNNVKG